MPAHDLHYWLGHYGAAALFVLLMLGIVGLPIPDETLLAFAGTLIYRGRLNPLTAIPAALAGTMCGITLSYLIGRLSERFLERYGRYVHLTPARLEKAHAFSERFGKWALLLGYFIPGIRHLAALLAGTARLHFGAFALYAYTGAAIWAGCFLALGYFLGERWGYVHAYFLHEHVRQTVAVTATVAGIGLLALIAWWYWRLRGRRRVARR